MPKPTPPDVDEIRRDIERDRARLADTMAALAYRANVPARVKESVAERIAAAKRSAFGTRAAVEPPAAEDALRLGDAGDEGAMLALESAADVVEALGEPSSRLRDYASRNPRLVAIGAIVCAIVLVALSLRRKKPGRDKAA
jgi:hypothetical protein